MSEQKVPRSVEQRIVIKFLVVEKSRPLKFTTDSNNSMGKSVSYGDTLPHTVAAAADIPAADRFQLLGMM